MGFVKVTNSEESRLRGRREVRVGKLKNGKAAGKGEVTVEMRV